MWLDGDDEDLQACLKQCCAWSQEIRKYFEHFREFVRQQRPEDNDEEEDNEKLEKERKQEEKEMDRAALKNEREKEEKEIDKAALKLLNQFLFKSLSALAIDVDMPVKKQFLRFINTKR